MTPVEALERIVHCLDRAHGSGFRTKAFARALEVTRSLDPTELAERASAGTLTELDGIGDSSAKVIEQALAGGEVAYVAELEARTRVPLTAAGAVYREALLGDLHLHSRWSDGSATVEAMARAAIALGHEYLVLTDHSPRLTVAHGLSAERLAQQVDEVAELNHELAPFRVLTGIEVDILADGALDHGDDVLGHCTGRMIGKRDPSSFDADEVFATCATFRTAVEINCRPEWQPFGCNRAAEVGVPVERVLNTLPVGALLAWTRGE